jgi:hypothetical protein
VATKPQEFEIDEVTDAATTDRGLWLEVHWVDHAVDREPEWILAKFQAPGFEKQVCVQTFLAKRGVASLNTLYQKLTQKGPRKKKKKAWKKRRGAVILSDGEILANEGHYSQISVPSPSDIPVWLRHVFRQWGSRCVLTAFHNATRQNTVPTPLQMDEAAKQLGIAPMKSGAWTVPTLRVAAANAGSPFVIFGPIWENTGMKKLKQCEDRIILSDVILGPKSKTPNSKARKECKHVVAVFCGQRLIMDALFKKPFSLDLPTTTIRDKYYIRQWVKHYEIRLRA